MEAAPTVPARDAQRAPVGNIEKQPSVYADVQSDGKSESDVDEPITDLFASFPALKGVPLEKNPLTVRAVLTGIVLGSLVNASNVYLGLKTGFTFTATMFGAIFGNAIILLLTKAFPGVPGIGTPFGPQENSIIQAAATGAGGMAGMFVAGLPAMYRLNLLSEDPKADFPRILTITIVCALFGLFVAVPLRKFFIINVARELNMVFPTPTATAMAIRSMHAVGSGAADAMKKIKALGYCFVGAFLHIVVSQYADGILHNWHVFTWFFLWSGRSNWALNIENWGWYIQLTPAFFGSGILVGLNAAISWWGGTLVAWGLIGPLLVHYGECVGKAIQTEEPEKWKGLMNFNSLSGLNKPGYVPSPRYWMLWPGVLVLIVYSLVEFVLHFRIIYDGAKLAFRGMAVTINNGLQARGKSSPFFEKHAAKADDETSLLQDFATKDQQVPTWVWISGAAAVMVVSCLVCHFQFNINAGLAILACILGFVFAFLSIYGGAVTDTTPLTASAKASQLVFGGITKGHMSVPDAQRVNLIAGNIASGCAAVANELTSDFRVGFLLRTPPHLQFYAQAIGTLVSIFIAPGVFVLFMAAYPCVWNENASSDHCPFKAPSVVAWKAVAEAVTLPSIPISLSCAIFSIVMGVIAALQAVFKNFYLVGEREKYRQWLPNWMAIGVAWVLGVDSGYANAILIGSIVGWWWQKRSTKSFEIYGFSIAAGLIAGEGFAGVVNAALTLGGVDGNKIGTKIALPGESW
ncbi:Oligopeptide transporter [Tolypocladium paradoxum]|uniref:Oligopeptide transporter n=1 Tax=Tolypocladium paradoxum TaxID=94208 RepID=A0A2S4KM32_9HYPO|nr:Oligopeptide transporter [Tolypocladium paradoxum]